MREHERAALEAESGEPVMTEPPARALVGKGGRIPADAFISFPPEVVSGGKPIEISAADAPAPWTPLGEVRETVRKLRADIATYEGGIRNAEHTYRASVDSYRQRIRTAEHRIREWEALIVLAAVRAPEEESPLDHLIPTVTDAPAQ